MPSTTLTQVELALEVFKILAILGTGLGVIITVLKTATGLVVTVTRAVTRFEFVGEQQGIQIQKLEVTVSKIAEIVLQMAVEKTRLDNQSTRLNRIETLVDELRRGDGYILPMRPAGEFGSSGHGPP